MNNLIEDVAANHFSAYSEAAKALQEMFVSAFDLQSDNFQKAAERFKAAVERANKEKERLRDLG